MYNFRIYYGKRQNMSVILQVPDMNKSKNTMSLKNLAVSLKKSIDFDLKKSNTLASSKSTVQLKPYSVRQETKNIKYQKEQKLHILTSDTDNPNPIQIYRDKLYKQIEQVQEQVQGKTKKLVSRQYDSQLQKYDKILKEMEEMKIRKGEQSSRLLQVRQRQRMLRQDWYSKQCNLQHQLAYGQYCEQVLQNYRIQHQNQSKLVMSTIELKQQIDKCKQEMSQLQNQINTKERQMIEWKQEIEYELNQKKIRNKITLLRMQLMKVQQEADHIANDKYLLKFRQLLCISFKAYHKQKQLILTSEDIEQGMEMYLCRENALQYYENQVTSYQNKHKLNYPASLIQQYFTVIRKIDNVMRKGRVYQDRKILNQYRKQIQHNRLQIINKQETINQNNAIIQQNQQKLQVLLANDSMVLIQHMRQVQGRYQLSSIKHKLKEIKKQQTQRIHNIQHIHHKYHQQHTHTHNDVEYLNALTQVSEAVEKEKKELKCITHKQKQLQEDKEELQRAMSMAITKWNQTSQKKNKLKLLYKQLASTNQQLRQYQQHKDLKESKLINSQYKSQRQLKQFRQFKDKTMEKTKKYTNNNKENMLKIKSSYAIDHHERHQPYQQNEGGNTYKTDKYNYSCKPLCIKDNNLTSKIITRKPSFSSCMLKGKENTKNVYESKSQRASLTAMLFSKLTKC